MYLHTVAWSASLGAGPNLDTAFSNDDVLGNRNNHLIVTDPYRVICAAPIGALITRMRFGNAALQRYSFVHLWPLIVSAAPTTNPVLNDMRDTPLVLPQNEEITVESSNSAVGPTATNLIGWLAADGWTQNLPGYITKLTVRATVTVGAGSATTWGPLGNIAFERDLLNGVYAVTGCTVVAATGIAFRIRFPDQRNVYGKQHRPGFLIQPSATLQPSPLWDGDFGEWGRFHTFTPPQIQTFADAAGGTYEVRLTLLYLGEDRSLLYR